MPPIIKWIFVAVIPVVFAGCYYDNKSELYPNICDTTAVGFATFVKPAIDRDCKLCHSGASPVGVVPLNNHAEIAASAASGTLMGSLSHAAGFKAMPQGGNQWTECELKKIKKWIDAGAPNN